MANSPKSNWDAYYSDDHFAVPEFIDNALWNNYEKVLLRHLPDPKANITVTELGGANSCYYKRFKKSFNIERYNIVDNNEIGLNLFPFATDHEVSLINFDLLQSAPEETKGSSDVVLSSGLIEHFNPSDTARLVRHHFETARTGGLVVISFPTPTAIYKVFRRFLEMTGQFPPLFERPIEEGEILPVLSGLGTTVETYKIWTTILTQLLVVTRKA